MSPRLIRWFGFEHFSDIKQAERNMKATGGFLSLIAGLSLLSAFANFSISHLVVPVFLAIISAAIYRQYSFVASIVFFVISLLGAATLIYIVILGFLDRNAVYKEIGTTLLPIYIIIALFLRRTCAAASFIKKRRRILELAT